MTSRWLSPVVIGAMLIFVAVVYPSLPAEVPTHWNYRGEVDGWSSREWGAFFAPVLATALWLLLTLLRKVDPRRRNYERFDATFWLIVNLVVMFLGAMHVLALGSALGWGIDMTRWVLVLLGLMFAGLGNYMPRLRSNWWMGVRTPWTLESETVWRATHRVAGYTFVAGGLVAIVAALLPTGLAFVVAMIGLALAAVIPVVYSYIAYRRERTAG
ncbi:MAG: SdpI family protein [Gemmatimonadetes bacterium]|nr:SdpI family protein [Gemmatimonadota bacterium]